MTAQVPIQTVATGARSLLHDGLVVVSVNVKWDPISCKKKVLPALRGWQSLDIEKARSSLVENANGVAIITGAKSGVIVVDVDLPGLEQWHEVVPGIQTKRTLGYKNKYWRMGEQTHKLPVLQDKRR